MLLIATAVAVVVPHAADERIAMARTARLTDIMRIRTATSAIETWVAAVLLDDGDGSAFDHDGETWARPVEGLAVEGVVMSGRVVDEQARFNLNGLIRDGRIDPLALRRFESLLEALDLPVTLAASVLDWLDADDVPRTPGGAEAGMYLAREPGYVAPNQPMAAVSELLLMSGFDRATYLRLRPHVTALPLRTAVNVNTASAELLMAIIPDADESAVRAFVTTRRSTPLEDITAVRAHPLFNGPEMELDGLSVGSDWFRIVGHLETGRVKQDRQSLLRRTDDAVQVVARWSGMP